MSSDKLKALKNIKALQFITDKLGFKNHDLPLNNSEDTKFLLLLIALMTFLTILTFSTVFILNNLANRWSSGLENKVTIEIPIETPKGEILSQNTIQKETNKISKALQNDKNIKSLEILTASDIQDLISPWIGDNLTLDDLPLPGLIAIELKKADSQSIHDLETTIKETSQFAYLETHHKWLADVIGFARTLKTLSLIIAIIILGITITALTAGMHTRMAIHKKELGLLHAIGASDHYIAQQFQNHAMILTAKGAIIGAACGGIITFLFVLSSAKNETALLPTIQLGILDILALLCTPLIIIAIATIASRFTVLHSLAKMP